MFNAWKVLLIYESFARIGARKLMCSKKKLIIFSFSILIESTDSLKLNWLTFSNLKLFEHLSVKLKLVNWSIIQSHQKKSI
jgi:hypothetical protein